jgi:PPOX class probable F420-dependent enzyme
MKLSPEQALSRLAAHDHGVLSTLHPDRGIDSVPVVYAVSAAGQLSIPIDTIKPKQSTNLQRIYNLDRDPRATLLVQQWNASDWSQLWWVRMELRVVTDPSAAAQDEMAQLLAQKYPQYSEQPFARVLVFDVMATTGWSAS